MVFRISTRVIASCSAGFTKLPFHGNQLVEGWQFSAIVQSQSGNPVNIVVNNAAFTGTNNTVRPDVTGPIEILGTPNRWFDIAPFVVPVDRFGNLGRNVVIGPGFNNTDFSVIKRTKLTPVARARRCWTSSASSSSTSAGWTPPS